MTSSGIMLQSHEKIKTDIDIVHFHFSIFCLRFVRISWIFISNFIKMESRLSQLFRIIQIEGESKRKKKNSIKFCFVNEWPVQWLLLKNKTLIWAYTTKGLLMTWHQHYCLSPEQKDAIFVPCFIDFCTFIALCIAHHQQPLTKISILIKIYL